MAELHHEEAFLLSAANSIEADMIEAILNANDIPVLRKYKESGGYLKIYMGDTIYGVDLYVPQPLLDKARDIIEVAREASQDEDFAENAAIDKIPEDPMNNGTAGEDEIPEESKLEKESKEEKCDMSDNEELISQEEKVNRKRRLNSWIILLLFTPGILWVIIALIVYLFERF